MFVLSAVCTVSSAQNRFTAEQKEQDFEYLYQTLRENYPYFGVLRRTTGRDWLAGHDRYLKMVRESTDDRSFAKALQAIMRELGNGHAYVVGPHMFDEMSRIYHEAAAIPGKERYRRWAAVFDRAQPHYEFLKELYGVQPAAGGAAGDAGSGYDPARNLSLDMLGGGKIGVLTIHSFGNPAGDSALLMRLLDSV